MIENAFKTNSMVLNDQRRTAMPFRGLYHRFVLIQAVIRPIFGLICYKTTLKDSPFLELQVLPLQKNFKSIFKTNTVPPKANQIYGVKRIVTYNAGIKLSKYCLNIAKPLT